MNFKLIVTLIGIAAVILAGGALLLNRGIIGKGKITLPERTQPVGTTAETTAESTAGAKGPVSDKPVEQPLTSVTGQADSQPVSGKYSYEGVIKELNKLDGDMALALETGKDKRVVHFLISTSSTVIQKEDPDTGAVVSSSLDKLAVGKKVGVVASFDSSVGQYGTWTTLGVVIKK